MSSIAVFLVIGGATAFAALGKNSVGTKQLKKNAVTTAKIKKNAVTTAKIKKGAITGDKVEDGTLTGAKINLSTLGIVPSANSANSANSLAGRTAFSFFSGPGLSEIVTVGPFSVKADCRINNVGKDEAELQLYTSVDGAAMDDNSGDEFTSFGIADSPAQLLAESQSTGEEGFEADEGQLVAVAPDGTTIVTESQGVGFNVAGHPGQCFFAGVVEKIG
jgi:hypothetical protein